MPESPLVQVVLVLGGTAAVCAALGLFVLKQDDVRWRLFQAIEFAFLAVGVYAAFTQVQYAVLREAETRAERAMQLVLGRLSIGIQPAINERCSRAPAAGNRECDMLANMRQRLTIEWPAARFPMFGQPSAGRAGMGDGEREYVEFLRQQLRYLAHKAESQGVARSTLWNQGLEETVHQRIGNLISVRHDLAEASTARELGKFWYLLLAASAAIRVAIWIKDLRKDLKRRRDDEHRNDKESSAVAGEKPAPVA